MGHCLRIVWSLLTYLTPSFWFCEESALCKNQQLKELPLITKLRIIFLYDYPPLLLIYNLKPILAPHNDFLNQLPGVVIVILVHYRFSISKQFTKPSLYRFWR